jgi:hypothetical protein
MAETAFDCRQRQNSNKMRIIALRILAFITTLYSQFRNWGIQE